MTTEITIKCCEGEEKYPGQCLKERCPIYVAAKEKVYLTSPRAHSGFDSFYVYGEPGHHTFLHQVTKDIQNEIKKTD